MQTGDLNSASDTAAFESSGRAKATKARSVPLAVLLLAVVILLVGAVSGAVIYENYRRGVATAMDVGHQQFDNLRTEIAVQEQQLLQPLEFALSIFAANPNLGDKHPDDLEKAFCKVLETNMQVTEVRVIYDDGEAFAVANLGGPDGRLRSALAAPEEARFAERRVVHTGAGGRELSWSFIGPDHQPLGSFSMTLPPEALSKEDPWAAAARNSPGRVIETKADLIPSLHAAGMTFASTFSGAHPGVIATDVSLSQLSQMLGALKSGDDDQIFVFDGDGTLLASPDLDPVSEKDNTLILETVKDLHSPVSMAMTGTFRATGPYAVADIESGGARYLTSVISIGADDPERPSVYLGLALPEVTFTGALIEASRAEALISMLILLAAVPIVVFIARRTARPLSRLQEITDGIARLDMDQDIRVPTHISEIARLSGSISHMRNALGQVAKFVPKSLVTDLLRSGHQIGVDGERRELSLVFTDVRDFTPMVEAAAPDALMAQMSEYFDAIAGAILNHHGTIDKYIGDAVFAFWNAPVRHERHALMACEAVLTACAASKALNERWQTEGKPAWHTCFSVHTGEAVVGNVGSRDRLNYTAVGNAVNMAARIEGLNRSYGTQVLVTAVVADAVRDKLHVRPVDLAVPKGGSQPLMIYELLGANDAPEKSAAWEKFYAAYAARDWRRAYGLIVDFTDTYSDDRLGEIFRERIIGFLANPPPATWDGVTRFESK